MIPLTKSEQLVPLLVFIIFVCFSFGIPHVSAENSAQKKLTPINVQLKWRHQFQFAGYYAAAYKGIYQNAGLGVTLREANPTINPIEEVLSGKADFGIANSELMLYRLNGDPVTAIAGIIQHSPMVVMSLKESNILSPQDLIGKKLMYPSGSYGANTLGILLKEGIKESQVESIPLSFNINDLINKNVDAMVGYITNQPFLLKERGIEYNLIHPTSYGVDFYGDVLFTHQKYIEENPELVEGFRKATIEGWRYAIEHPNEIIDVILSQYPTVKNRKELEYEAQETIKLIVPKLVELGHMNPGRWKYIAETFIDLKMASGDFDDNGFLYDPEKEHVSQILHSSFQILAILSLLAASFISVLFYFNKQLKSAIAEKTMYLTKANRELIVYTKQLKEKEDELHALNTDLEKRIIKRTETINQVNHELTQEAEQRKRREVSLGILSKAIESSSSIVLIIDKEHLISYASPAFLALTGFSEHAISNQPIKVLENKLALPDISNTDFLPNSNGLIESELKCTGYDGEIHWMNTSISLLWTDQQEISHYVIIFEDVTQLRNRKDEMEKMALYDPLTGLENRVLFQSRLKTAIQNAKRNMQKTALLFIDIDNFKTINDSLGHEAGDIVLKNIATRLKDHVRQNDSIARISGDEFTILLSDISNYEDASKVTSQLLESFNKPIYLNSREIFVTASIGISITPEDSLDMPTLMKNADIAMYQAKQNGRNNFQFFSEDMNIEIMQKNIIENQLRESIDNQNFFLVYLPKVDLKNNCIIGAEGLLRWQFSEQVIRYPNEFIPIAEETGLILPLGQWVLKQAFNDIGQMLKAGIKHIKISINLSPRQLQDSHFVSEVRELFAAHPNYIEYFELEITEQCFIDKQPENIGRLKELQSMGFSITIDDFGIGYSSLSHLKRLPIETIKIDQALIRGLPANKNSAEISSAIIAMAHELNLSVVAEGVENEEQATFLKSINCDAAHGLFYEDPMPFESLIEHFSIGKPGQI